MINIDNKKGIFKIIGACILGLLVIMALCEDGALTNGAWYIEQGLTHKDVRLVKDSYFMGCHATMGETFDKYFDKAKWRSFKSDKGEIVEFNGVCRLNNKKVNCTIQYVLSPDKTTYDLYTMAFNEIPQNILVYSQLMTNIETVAIGSDGKVKDKISYPGEVEDGACHD